MKSAILFLAYLALVTLVQAEEDEKYHHSFLLPFSGKSVNPLIFW